MDGSSPWGLIKSSSEESAVIRQPVFMNRNLTLSANITFSWGKFQSQISMSFITHSWFNWLSIQAEVWKYTSTSWSYWAFSALDTFPLPWNTITGFTRWSPSARMHSCSVACLLSRPEEGWETQTFLIYSKGQRNLIYIVSVLWCPSSILHILSFADDVNISKIQRITESSTR